MNVNTTREIERVQLAAKQHQEQLWEDWTETMRAEHQHGRHSETQYLSCPDCLIAAAFARVGA